MFNSVLMQAILGFEKRGDVVLDKLGDVRLEYDPHSVIGNKLFVSGQFEEYEIRFFSDLLKQFGAPVVLDVGANIGLHSIRWATSCPSLRAYAFEPSRETLQMVRNNVKRSGHSARIEVIPQAVSDRVGVGEFFHCEDDAYSSLRDTRRKRVVDSYQVDITTIDSFIFGRGLSKVDLVKIDVEGFEREVLMGGVRTLSEFRPHLFVEIFAGANSNPDPEGTVDFVQSLGYDAYVFKDGVPWPFVRHSDAFFNYYFRSKA
jgi:FkbM family methyltransferase